MLRYFKNKYRRLTTSPDELVSTHNKSIGSDGYFEINKYKYSNFAEVIFEIFNMN